MQKSPQLEEGYIRIANELYDAVLSFPFKASTLRVLMAVIRKTYGFGKKEDDISASQIGEMCGMNRNHVTEALNELAAMQVINKRPGRYGSILGVNKDYSRWLTTVRKTSPKSGQVSESRTSPNLGQVSESGTVTSPNLGHVGSPNLGHTKDNFPKDKRQKDLSGKPSNADLTAKAKEAIEYLNEKVSANFKPVQTNLKFVLDRLNEGYSLDDVKAVVDAKAAQWGNDPKMAEYLRPATLFNATKFNQYIGQLPKGGGEWWVRLGFPSAFAAENAGYSQYSAKVPA